MRVRCVVFLMALSLIAAGCAKKASVPEFHAQYYSACYDPINFLCKQRDNSEEMKGAGKGALLGGLIGLGAGLLSGKPERAVAGLVAGAIVGGTAGYFTARISKNKERDVRLAEYQRYLGENSKGWDLERTTVEASYKCYRDEIRNLKALAKGKRISREEFVARMNEIKAGVEHINTYWAGAQERMDARLADGEKFLAEQEEEDKRLAAGRQRAARAQLQAQRRNTQMQRSQKDSDVAKMNALKADTEEELKALDSYYETSLKFG